MSHCYRCRYRSQDWLEEEVLLEALLATTGERPGGLWSSTTATDGVQVGATGIVEVVEAAELGESAPVGGWWLHSCGCWC